MAEPARAPGSSPGRPSIASSPAGAAVTTIAVPVTVWPAIPAPARCPASPGHLPCPRRYTSAAAQAVIGALSRPGDLVAAPRPGDEAFLAAAARAGRRAAGPDVPPPGGHYGDGTGAAALAVVTACPAPWCRPPAPAGADGTDPGLPWAACQRVLGGLFLAAPGRIADKASRISWCSKGLVVGVGVAAHPGSRVVLSWC